MSEAEEFEGVMYQLEDALADKSRHLWYAFEKESGDFWDSVEANNWKEAFEKDAMSCISYKQVLLSYLKD